jgi:hypothetical protein
MKRKPSSRFRPSVESLEDRQLMSVGVSLTIRPGDSTRSLIITPDDGDNSINVINNGAGHIIVDATGLGAVDFFDVDHVDISPGNGNNNVHYFQDGDAFNRSGDQLRPLSVSVNLGPGDNVFQADLSGHVLKHILGFSVDGGGGANIIVFNAKGVNIAADGELGMYLALTPTKNPINTVSMDYSGVKEGSLVMDGLLGGQGLVDATFADGSRRAQGDFEGLEGGSGDDTLEVFLHDAAGIHPFGLIDGGGGFNTARHFDNVKAVNCQRDIVTHIGGHLQKVGPLGGGLGHMPF